MRRDDVTASSRKYSISPCRSSWNIGFDERTKIRMHGERVSLLALTIARKKVFVSSTVSRPNNSARRTPRSRLILYPMALQGAGKESVSVPVTSSSQPHAPPPDAGPWEIIRQLMD